MSQRRRQRGFALLIVLWTMVLLALLGTTITGSGHMEARIAGNLRASAGAEAAADGAVAVAAFHLLDASAAHWQPDGAAHKITVGDSDVVITIEDDRGKIDVNDAPPGLISALLRQLGVDPSQAASVADAITDWRSPSDTGLQASYRSDGRQWGPPHDAFETTDELLLVRGMTPDLLALMRPYLSLFVEQTPDVQRAAPPVAAAIADAVKHNLLTINVGEQNGPLIVTVTAVARNHGAVFTRAALLRMNGIAATPYEIIEWRARSPE